MRTLEEIKEYLIDNYDPDYLIELLDISSKEIVENFVDKIEENYEQIVSEIPDLPEWE